MHPSVFHPLITLVLAGAIAVSATPVETRNAMVQNCDGGECERPRPTYYLCPAHPRPRAAQATGIIDISDHEPGEYEPCRPPPPPGAGPPPPPPPHGEGSEASDDGSSSEASRAAGDGSDQAAGDGSAQAGAASITDAPTSTSDGSGAPGMADATASTSSIAFSTIPVSNGQEKSLGMGWNQISMVVLSGVVASAAGFSVI